MERDWIMMCNSELTSKGNNLALFPADGVDNTENLLNLVETSDAEIVVIDDLNGYFWKTSLLKSVLCIGLEKPQQEVKQSYLSSTTYRSRKKEWT